MSALAIEQMEMKPQRRAGYRSRSFLRRWAVRLGKGVVVLLALIGVSAAIPPIRNFVIDQIIYQGDFFFPVHQRSTVVRLVRLQPWATPVAEIVPVRNGLLQRGVINSRILHGEHRGYLIYLPPGYYDEANRTRRYPVLYLIHGSPGNAGSWVRGAHADFAVNEAIAAGTIAPLIMVMPDLNGGAWRDTECVNKWNGTDNEMSYFIQEVVPAIDHQYRTLADRAHRAIGGLSSGGYCAFNLALHNPGLFTTVFSISGYFHALRSEVFGLNDPFGHAKRFILANSPDLTVGHTPAVRRMHLIIADSTADWGYTGYAEQFDRILTRLHIPHLLVMRHPTGFHLWDHSWVFWRSMFRQILPTISASFGH